MLKILITGAGAPGGPGVIKCLQSQGFDLLVGDASTYVSGQYLAEKFLQLPHAEHNNFIDKLLSISKQAWISF